MWVTNHIHNHKRQQNVKHVLGIGKPLIFQRLVEVLLLGTLVLHFSAAVLLEPFLQRTSYNARCRYQQAKGLV